MIANLILDHVYLVCEPPGEPYYLGRIMEFLHVNNDSTQPIDALRLNWYYRPKDIGRKVNDTRQVFASMHSDISPLTALRGKCQIKHKSEVDKLDELRKTSDCFWYEKLYDRYIHRFYDVIPTSQVINVPVEVKKVLDERWRYIVVEPGRGKELTSAVKSCKRCSKYCARFVFLRNLLFRLLTLSKQRLGRLRSMSKHLPYELCESATTQEAFSWFCMGLRTV